jgi:hypothetical protein
LNPINGISELPVRGGIGRLTVARNLLFECRRVTERAAPERSQRRRARTAAATTPDLFLPSQDPNRGSTSSTIYEAGPPPTQTTRPRR